jgi:uncharacterized protein YbjQ (UPF0145 family)
MITTGRQTPAGYVVTEDIGIVVGTAVVGINAVGQWLASWTNIFGGRSETYEQRFKAAIAAAFAEMEQSARELGADAVVCIGTPTQSPADKGEFPCVIVCGTAVKMKRKEA